MRVEGGRKAPLRQSTVSYHLLSPSRSSTRKRVWYVLYKLRNWGRRFLYDLSVFDIPNQGRFAFVIIDEKDPIVAARHITLPFLVLHERLGNDANLCVQACQALAAHVGTVKTVSCPIGSIFRHYPVLRIESHLLRRQHPITRGLWKFLHELFYTWEYICIVTTQVPQ